MGGALQNDSVTSEARQRERSNVAIMHRVFDEVWNQRRLDVLHELFAPDFVSHVEHETLRGREAWLERFHSALLAGVPDLQVTVEGMVAEGSIVVTRWTVQGTQRGELFGQPPASEKIALAGISWTRIEGDRIVENWNSWNMSFLVRRMAEELRELRRVVPVCMYCKSVRDEHGHWGPWDAYLQRHSLADVSHSLCPTCAREHYPNEL